jgi:hypothetical protein
MESIYQKIIEQAYAGFNSRNIPAVLQLMHADVHWPRAFEGTYVSGHDNVQAYWQKQWTEIDPHVEPTAYTTRPDGSLAVDVHQLVKDLDGNVLADGHVKHVYKFQDGLIREMNVELD